MTGKPYNIIITRDPNVVDDIFFSKVKTKSRFSDFRSSEDPNTFIVAPGINNEFISMDSVFQADGKSYVSARFIETNRILEFFQIAPNGWTEAVLRRMEEQSVILGPELELDFLLRQRPVFYVTYGMGDDIRSWSGPYAINLADANLRLTPDGIRDLELLFTPSLDTLKSFTNKALYDVTTKVGDSVFNTRESTLGIKDECAASIKIELTKNRTVQGDNVWDYEGVKPLVPREDGKNIKWNYAIRKLILSYLIKVYSNVPRGNILVLFDDDLDKIEKPLSKNRDTMTFTPSIVESDVVVSKSGKSFRGRELTARVSSNLNKLGITATYTPEFIKESLKTTRRNIPKLAKFLKEKGSQIISESLTRAGKAYRARMLNGQLFDPNEDQAASRSFSLEDQLQDRNRQLDQLQKALLIAGEPDASPVFTILQSAKSDGYYVPPPLPDLTIEELAARRSDNTVLEELQPVLDRDGLTFSSVNFFSPLLADALAMPGGLQKLLDIGLDKLNLALGDPGTPLREAIEGPMRSQLYDDFNVLGSPTGKPTPMNIDWNANLEELELGEMILSMGDELKKDDEETPVLLRPLSKFIKRVNLFSDKYADFTLYEESNMKIVNMLYSAGLIRDGSRPVVIFGRKNLITKLIYKSKPALDDSLIGKIDPYNAEAADMGAGERRRSSLIDNDNFIDSWRAYTRILNDYLKENRKSRVSSYGEQPEVRKIAERKGVSNISDKIIFSHNIRNSNVLEVNFDSKPYVGVLLNVVNESAYRLIDEYGPQNVTQILRDNSIKSDFINTLAQQLREEEAGDERSIIATADKLIREDDTYAMELIRETERQEMKLSTFYELLIFKVLGSEAISVTRKVEQGKIMNAESNLMQKINQSIFNVNIRTLPFFNSDIFINESCFLYGNPNQVLGSDIHKRDKKPLSIFTNEYSIIGYKHHLGQDSAYSEFTLIQKGVPGEMSQLDPTLGEFYKKQLDSAQEKLNQSPAKIEEAVESSSEPIIPEGRITSASKAFKGIYDKQFGLDEPVFGTERYKKAWEGLEGVDLADLIFGIRLLLADTGLLGQNRKDIYEDIRKYEKEFGK
jgi:hypothetical protein